MVFASIHLAVLLSANFLFFVKDFLRFTVH